MAKSNRPFVFLDANVLYAPRIRELLFFYFIRSYSTPFWSVNVISEWKRVYKANNHGNNKIDEALSRAHNKMNQLFPKSELTISKKLRKTIRFNDDPNDVHVLAALKKMRFDFALTNDKKLLALRTYNSCKIISLENFFSAYIDSTALEFAIDEHIKTLNNPKVNKKEYKAYFKKNVGVSL